MNYYPFTTPGETDFLLENAKKELANGGPYLEMGVFAMGTIGQIASQNQHVTCWAVDRFDHRYLNDPKHATRVMIEGIYPDAVWTEDGLKETVKVVCKENLNIKVKVGLSRSIFIKDCAMQFIDADHSYEQVMADFWHAYAQSVQGGLIVGHDLQFPEIGKAVFEISQILGAPGRGPGSLWFYRKK
jgi:hypothetical protein